MVILGECDLDLWEFDARPEVASRLRETGGVPILLWHVSRPKAYFVYSLQPTLYQPG